MLSLPEAGLNALTQENATRVILVGTTAELVDALESQKANRHIRLRPGDYAVDHPLIVPDHVTLEGSGVMRYVGGLPTGFENGTETTIRPSTGFAGDLLTLGNNVALSGLRLQDTGNGAEESARRGGNVVVVGSRTPGDSLTTRITECEIINPHSFGVSPNGPIGHALLVLTRNPNKAEPPAPDEHATIAVRLERTILRATGMGGALFVIHFAAHSEISIALEGNRILGRTIASAGASRPDLVSNSSVSIASKNNLYSPYPGGSLELGWRLFGGSSSHIPGLAAPGARFNVMRFQSINDRIEGFRTGVMATAGRRWMTASGPVSDNRLELDLNGLQIRSEGDGAADLVLYGALSDTAPDSGPEFSPGDRNVLHVQIRGARGSTGIRANRYANVAGPALESNQGAGNRLEFAGSAEEFARSNTGFNPEPPLEFFQETP
jgi:hypothetical protein